MPIHAPFWGVFEALFPQIMSLIVLTPKGTIRGLNHVIWAINRENRSRGSSWACEREKKDRTGQDRKKVTKGLYFTYLWRSPHLSDVHENLCNGWRFRRNHVCQVSKWNFKGLQFYRGSNFPFFLLILNGPQQCSATALPVMCYIILEVFQIRAFLTHFKTRSQIFFLPPEKANEQPLRPVRTTWRLKLTAKWP